MRKFLSLFFVMALFVVGVSAQGLVQGQPHPTARNVPTKTKPELRADASFSFDNIKFWVGSGSKKAAMVIEWHDGKFPDAIVWGYRWDGEATGHDMIVAIVKADPRLLFLTQSTGKYGYTISGIGYSAEPLVVTYDLAGAIADPRVQFRVTEAEPEPLVPLGQHSFPETPAEDVEASIRVAQRTGVIYHPLNYERYGYASYDYDHWHCDAGSGHWASGWYLGYWSYWTRDSKSSEFTYSGVGATGRKLTDGSWDGWSWSGDMNSMNGTTLSDIFVAATVPTSSRPDIPVIPVTNVTLNKTSLRLQEGANAVLTTKITPVNADNKDIEWLSSDEEIATVRGGVVTGVQPGTVQITAKTMDGGHTAVCEVKVVEVVTPEIDFSSAEAVLSFPKVEEATSYEIRIYKFTNNIYTKIATYVTDANGQIVAELGTKSLLSASDRISVPLKHLGKDGVYAVEVQVMNKLEILDTYRLEKISNPVGNEYMPADVSRASFQNGMLHLENLEGYHFKLLAIDGRVWKTITPQSNQEFCPVSLSSGIYFLVGEKENERKTFKIQITH